MTIIRQLVINLIILLSVFISAGCSGTNSSLRYDDKPTDKSISTSNVRYNIKDNEAMEDTTVYDDDELSEFQDPSDLPEEESKIDLTQVMKNLEKRSTDSDKDALVSTKRELMLMEIIKYLNTPYKYGGNSLNGIDCSAFTQSVYKSSWLINLNRSAREQFQQGEVIGNRSDLKFGDLVFFNTRKRVKPGHVGIYIGDNLFAHASSKIGVTVSSLDYDYYNKRYMGARRIDEE